MKSTNKEFVQLENFILCFHAESMEGFWIVSAILQSKPMPHLWLYDKPWCFVLVAEYMLMVWENNLFSFDFWLRPSFYWSLCKGGFEPGSQFQPHFAQPLPKMDRKPNWDCPSPLFGFGVSVSMAFHRSVASKDLKIRQEVCVTIWTIWGLMWRCVSASGQLLWRCCWQLNTIPLCMVATITQAWLLIVTHYFLI